MPTQCRRLLLALLLATTAACGTQSENIVGYCSAVIDRDLPGEKSIFSEIGTTPSSTCTIDCVRTAEDQWRSYLSREGLIERADFTPPFGPRCYASDVDDRDFILGLHAAAVSDGESLITEWQPFADQ
jgi:hypothetical protein